ASLLNGDINFFPDPGELFGHFIPAGKHRRLSYFKYSSHNYFKALSILAEAYFFANVNIKCNPTFVPMLQNFSYSTLYNFSRAIFLKIGCSKSDSKIASDSLLAADIRGVDSHGVARLSGYVRLWEAKRVNAIPDIKIVYE